MLTVNSAELLPVLQMLKKVAVRKPIKPILGNLRLSTRGGQLIIQATNLDVYVEAAVRFESSGLESPQLSEDDVGNAVSSTMQSDSSDDANSRQHLLVNAYELFSLVRKARGNIALNLEGDMLRVNIAGACNMSGKLAVDRDEDFPAAPDWNAHHPDLTSIASLPVNPIREALDRLLFCTATDEKRYTLAGVYLGHHNGKLEMASTDTCRLSICTFNNALIGKDSNALPTKHKAKTAKDDSLILCQQGAIMARELANLATGDIQIRRQKDGGVIFITPNLRLRSAVIEGIFPRFHDVIPTPSAHRLHITNRKAFLSALRMVEQPDIPGVAFTRGEAGKLKLTCGSNVVETTAADTASMFASKFDGRYIHEALSACSSDNALIRFSSSNQAPISFEETVTSAKAANAPTHMHWQHIMMAITPKGTPCAYCGESVPLPANRDDPVQPHRKAGYCSTDCQDRMAAELSAAAFNEEPSTAAHSMALSA